MIDDIAPTINGETSYKTNVKTKKERLSRLLEVKNEIINEDVKNMVGRVYEVLVEIQQKWETDITNEEWKQNLKGGGTMTVREMIEFLEQFDEDMEVYLSNDNGYTYGSIDEYSFEEKEVEE